MISWSGSSCTVARENGAFCVYSSTKTPNKKCTTYNVSFRAEVSQAGSIWRGLAAGREGIEGSGRGDLLQDADACQGLDHQRET